MFSPKKNLRRSAGIDAPKLRLIDVAIVAGAIAVLLLPPTLPLPWVHGPDAGDRCATTWVVKNAPSARPGSAHG